MYYDLNSESCPTRFQPFCLSGSTRYQASAPAVINKNYKWNSLLNGSPHFSRHQKAIISGHYLRQNKQSLGWANRMTNQKHHTKINLYKKGKSRCRQGSVCICPRKVLTNERWVFLCNVFYHWLRPWKWNQDKPPNLGHYWWLIAINSLWPIDAILYKNLGRHWLRQWLGAWLHQAITWSNVHLS